MFENVENVTEYGDSHRYVHDSSEFQSQDLQFSMYINIGNQNSLFSFLLLLSKKKKNNLQRFGKMWINEIVVDSWNMGITRNVCIPPNLSIQILEMLRYERLLKHSKFSCAHCWNIRLRVWFLFCSVLLCSIAERSLKTNATNTLDGIVKPYSVLKSWPNLLVVDFPTTKSLWVFSIVIEILLQWSSIDGFVIFLFMQTGLTLSRLVRRVQPMMYVDTKCWMLYKIT